MRQFAYGLLGLVLTACGGGGTDGGSTAGSTAPPVSQGMQLSFAPGSLDATIYQGESQSFAITAQAGGSLPPAGKTINVGVMDSVGVLEPGMQVLPTSTTSFAATLTIARSLGVGTHQGAIEVRACQDDPRTCSKPIAGSPWQLPYRLTVRSQTDPRELSPVVDASNYYGSASHNASASSVLDPSRFSRRWSHPEAAAPSPTRPPALGNGHVFVSLGLKLAAFSERDGTQTWMSTLDDGTLSGPSLAGNRVYVVTGSWSPSSRSTLQSFDAASGAALGQVALSRYMGEQPNPVIRDGKLYLCKTGNALTRFDALSLQEEWTVTLAGDEHDPICSPAVDQRYAYVYRRVGLQVIDLASGRIAFTIPVPADSYFPPAMQQAPVLGAGGRVYLAAWAPWYGQSFLPRLLAFDTLQGKLAWNVQGNFNSNLVEGPDAVYVVNGSKLEARSIETGQPLWSWTSTDSELGGFNSPLLIVGKHALVSSRWMSYAIDLTTRQSVWQDKVGGPLALSPNGALYIQRTFAPGYRVINLH
ncbi:outer membrane protein assembly factor BamB family protein [Paucibacter soli]|uniref:outer membrane protein assembly factor BamB family protein n=1 Tax=Paucibacter soli TaxID=3133433 RepID=UPI0030AF2ADA